MRRGVELPLEFIWRFQTPERRFRGFPGGDDPAVWARLLDLTTDEYRALLDRYADELRTSVAALAAEAEVADAVRALPWGPGKRIVALGDSITAERASWLEVVRGLLDHLRPDDRGDLVNAGVSGDGTAHALSRLDDDVVLEDPDWVLVALGVNDARTHGDDPRKCLTSVDEFAGNLRQIAATVAAETDARLVLLTPTPVDEGRATLRTAGGTAEWRNRDIDERADAVRDVAGDLGVLLIDVHEAFDTTAVEGDVFHLDGVHPNAAGQRTIARTVVRAIAQSG